MVRTCTCLQLSILIQSDRSDGNVRELTSKSSHQKTHELLHKIVQEPQADPLLLKLVQEIHAMLSRHSTSNDDMVHRPGDFTTPKLPSNRGVASEAIFDCTMSDNISHASILMPISAPMSSIRRNHAKMSLRTGPTGSSTTTSAYNVHCDPDTLHSFDDSKLDIANTSSGPQIHAMTALPYRVDVPTPPTDNNLSLSVQYLNAKRRATSKKQLEAYRAKHHKPAKPSFLITPTPTLAQLQTGIAYLFRSDSEHSSETTRWMEGFCQYANGPIENKDLSTQVDLLVELNSNIERSSKTVRARFYEASYQTRLAETLERLQTKTRSVRILKEIEEFEDAQEEWREESA